MQLAARNDTCCVFAFFLRDDDASLIINILPGVRSQSKLSALWP
jgi:hypothetical protein